MESTCIKEECKYWDKGACPNYIQTTWINEQDNTPKIVEDCAPQRTVRMLMDMHSHLMGYKQYACQTRNKLNELTKDTRNFMAMQANNSEHATKIITRIEERQEKLIEEQKKEKKDAIPANQKSIGV